MHLAIIEALYQGRYKAVSAQQILTLWLKRNHPSYHFNMEFERLICNKLPEDLRWNNSLPPLPPALPSVSGNPTIQDVMKNYESQTQTSDSSDTYVEKQQYFEDDYYQELEYNEIEEDSKVREVSKLLPSSSSMVFISQSESSTSTNRSIASRTLTETRNYVVTDSEYSEPKESKQIEQIEEPFDSDKIVYFLPPERNHPPIEQFTPEKIDSSDTFTSKLKGVMG